MKLTPEIIEKLKRLTNESWCDYMLDAEYTLTWEEQLQEFKDRYEAGALSDRFIDFSLGIEE